MNSQKPQNIFEAKTYTGVRQDKNAQERISARLREPVRATILAHKPQKHGSNKRQTVEVAGYVLPSIRAELERIAQAEGLSLSKVVATLLTQSILLLVDEAGRTAIPSLSEAATTINGRGISLWIAIQSLGQLDAVYGRVHARILRDNMDSQVFYRPCDQETAEYLQKCLGYQSGFARSESDHAGVLTSGRSEREIPLLTAQEVKQMADTEVIVFHRHLAPIKARRMDWRHVELLRKRISLPAPVLQGSGQRPVMPIKESITSGRSQRDSYLIYKRN